MKVRCFAPADLPPELRARWVALQEAEPRLASPYFRLEFTEATARARADTFIAVAADGEAFLPFHREALNMGVGRPVGSHLSAYHGPIAGPGDAVDPVALVRGAGLSGWEFNHLPSWFESFRPWATGEAESTQVEIGHWVGG